VLELAEQTGLSELLDEHVRFTSEVVRSGAANPTPKLTSIIGGLLAGADSIGDLDVIRSGGTHRLFGGVYAPTTLGTLLREFTGGHVRQLQAVQGRHLLALAQRTGVLDGIGERAFVDIDSLLRPVYGHATQGRSGTPRSPANRYCAVACPHWSPRSARRPRRRWSPGSGCGPAGPAPGGARPAWSPRPSTWRKRPAPRTSWSVGTPPTATVR
jgi:hypothetical protein